ncbi:MAG: DUF4062 domain-containing protein [Candidatus Cloacimonetes bacterium]|nr:DUF4062 domain-containing protein [Candidatus Cloacimonadota bacterium]
MQRRRKIIRVFVSSTFEDFKLERDALQLGAFKNLRTYCQKQGWQFQAVDLRWGISNEATIDQRTMEICLKEIERCQTLSPKPNFVVLLGQRYGWCPLPDKILESVFEQMKEELIDEKLLDKFNAWYDLDENELPEPVWGLQPRSGRFFDINEFETEVEKPLSKFFSDWAAKNLPDPNDEKYWDDPKAKQRLKMERSATEQEIQVGALKIDNAEEHVIAYFRDKIKDCPSGKKDFIDNDLARINNLKKRLKDKITERNIIKLPAIWDKDKDTLNGSHLQELSDEIEERLKKIIDSEIEKYSSVDENEMEDIAHIKFAEERSCGFAGREDDLKILDNYINSDDRVPLIIYGESGVGKTSLMSKALLECIARNKNNHQKVIGRFIGTTGKSSNGNSLLHNICYKICREYNGNSDEIPLEPSVMQYKFNNYLSMVTEEKPLIVFIDALDQFYDNDPFVQMNWLPEELPEQVKIIISTLKGKSYDILFENKKYKFLELNGLTIENGEEALRYWLKGNNRKLRDHQFNDVIKGFQKADCNPLYLKLAFDQVKKWKSKGTRVRLGHSIQELIEDLYKALARPEFHGTSVDRVLPALRCAKNGLSDDEILGILANDNEFWNGFGIQSFHEYPHLDSKTENQKLIPPVLWIRLYHDLEYYLTRRAVPGGEVITFYHRQLAEAIDEIYFWNESEKTNKHKEIAKYFMQKKWFRQIEPVQIPNVRKCDELPWQQTQAGMWDELTATLCDLDFIQAKSAAGMTYELVKDFNNALEAIPDNAENNRNEKERQARLDKYAKDIVLYAEGKIKVLDIPPSITPWTEEQIDTEIERIKTYPTRADRLRDFLNFLRHESSNLQDYASEFPHFATQQAWNYVIEGPVGKVAENRSAEIYNTLLLRVQSSRPVWNPLTQVLQTLKGHTDCVSAVSISPNGRRAISGSADETCIVWDLESGEPIQTLKGHTSDVLSVSISADGKRAISGSDDKSSILWDLESGKQIQTLKGHSDRVYSVSISPDGRRAISGSEDESCILWNLESGKSIHTLKGHSGRVYSVSISADGRRAISGSDDESCILWDLESGKPIHILKGHSGRVYSVSISPDGRRAISGSILWNLESGEPIQKLKCIFNKWNSVSICPDGKLAISESYGMTSFLKNRNALSQPKACYLWDLESGEPIKTLKGHIDEVMSVSICADGSRAISGSKDCTCILWDPERGKLLQNPIGHNYAVSSIPIRPDGKRVIYKATDWDNYLWDLESGKQSRFPIPGDVSSIPISPDGRQAIGKLSKNFDLLDLESGKQIQHFEKEQTHFINTVSFSPDGKRVISGYEDNTCILWDLESGKQIQTLIGHDNGVIAASFSPDGRRVISSSWDKTCILWDLVSGKPIKTLIGHKWGVMAVCFSPDGRQAVSSSDDRTCIVWDLENGKSIHILNGHTERVNTISISADGKRVISGSDDRTCILWDMVSGEKIAIYKTLSKIKSINQINNTFYLECEDTDIPGEIIPLKSGNGVLNHGFVIVTVRKIWDSKNKIYLPFSADCPFCGHRFKPPEDVLETIRIITKEAGLRPDQSPCLELPDKYWDDPGLLSECPKCHEKLKYNPFVVDNSEGEEGGEGVKGRRGEEVKQ